MQRLLESVQNFAVKRQLERMQAELAKQAGIMDYIAMMADVEIPVEEETFYVV